MENKFTTKKFKSVQDQFSTPKLGGSKPTTAGIHYGYNLTSIDILDKRIEFKYEKPETNNYITQSIWTTNYSEFKDDEDKQRFYDRLEANISKLLYIFCPEDVADKIEASTINAFIEKAVAMILKYKNSTKVNVGLIYDKSGKYTEVSSRGIEKYTEEGLSNIQFTEWEELNRMTKSTETKTKTSRPIQESDLPF